MRRSIAVTNSSCGQTRTVSSRVQPEVRYSQSLQEQVCIPNSAFLPLASAFESCGTTAISFCNIVLNSILVFPCIATGETPELVDVVKILAEIGGEVCIRIYSQTSKDPLVGDIIVSTRSGDTGQQLTFMPLRGHSRPSALTIFAGASSLEKS